MSAYLKNLALLSMLTGILLLPLAADAQCYSNGTAYQCSVPETTSEYVPQAETVSYEEAPEVEVIPAMAPVQGGTWWHKSRRWGNWWENKVDYGKWWNWNNTYDWDNRYDWNDRYTSGSPGGGGCADGSCGSPASYQSGPSYGGGGYSPMGSGSSYGGGPNYLGGFDSNPYWGYSMGSPSNFGGGGFRGHPDRDGRFMPNRRDRDDRFGHMRRPDRDRRFMPNRRDHDNRFGQMGRPHRGMGFTPRGRGHNMGSPGRHGNPGHRGWQTKNFHSLPGDHEKIEWKTVTVDEEKINPKIQWATEDINSPSTMFAKKEWKTVSYSDGLTPKIQWETKSLENKLDSNPNRWVAKSVEPSAFSSGTVMIWVAQSESSHNPTMGRTEIKVVKRP